MQVTYHVVGCIPERFFDAFRNCSLHRNTRPSIYGQLDKQQHEVTHLPIGNSGFSAKGQRGKISGDFNIPQCDGEASQPMGGCT
jgi:hypothetical protein